MSQPSYKNDYEYYIKNPNILADKIVEIYDNNPNNPYETYKNLVLDRIDNEEVSTSNDDSFIKNVGKEFIKNLKGDGINV